MQGCVPSCKIHDVVRAEARCRSHILGPHPCYDPCRDNGLGSTFCGPFLSGELRSAPAEYDARCSTIVRIRLSGKSIFSGRNCSRPFSNVAQSNSPRARALRLVNSSLRNLSSPGCVLTRNVSRGPLQALLRGLPDKHETSFLNMQPCSWPCVSECCSMRSGVLSCLIP